MTWAPPTNFEEYTIVRAIGAGTMGHVFLAHDRILDRQVAIKFVSAVEIERDHRERFFTEARAIARLSHPNVVAIYRVGEIQHRPYLVSEFVQGPSLASISKPLPWERVLSIGIGLARGLGIAHRRGVLHRDVKPANVMIDDDDEAKLLDFGLAQLADAHNDAGAVPSASQFNCAVDATVSVPGRQLTATPREGPIEDVETIVGTPLYLAPEVWAGARATSASDVYSLGVVLYELLVGHAPNAGLSFDDLAFAAQNCDPKPVSTGSGVAEVPTRLAHVIDACLSRDPASRPASGDVLCERLEAIRPSVAGTLPGSPYRGLSSFEPEHRSVFFGRAEETRAVVERLRTETLVIVAGDSGAGKSSLCRSAVLPVLAEKSLGGRRWHLVSIVPGPRPRAVLEQALAERQPDEGLLIFVDQLEELLTISDPTEAAWFATQIAELVVARSDTRILASARTDFLGRIAELSGLGDLVGRALFLLGPLSERGLRDAIVGPARALGYEFESTETVDQLVASGRRHLPLLQFTLAELWETRDDVARKVPADALLKIGGVTGALSRRADQVMASLGDHERAIAWRVLLRLTSADGTRAVMTRAELREVTGGAELGIVERLVNARLLVVGGDGNDRIEIAHEALITGWPRLAEWRRTHEDGTRLRDQFSEAARRWHDRGRRRGLLWRGDALLEYRRWRARWTEPLTEVESAFGDACVGESRRWRRRIVAGSIALFALLSASTIILYQLRLYFEQGLAELEHDRATRSVPFLLQAMREGENSVALRFALAIALRPLKRIVYQSRDDRFDGFAWHPDGKRFAARGENGALIFFDQNGKELWRRKTSIPNSNLKFSGGRLVVYPRGTRPSSRDDGRLEIWDAETGLVTHAFDSRVRYGRDVVVGSEVIEDKIVQTTSERTTLWSLNSERIKTLFEPKDGALICDQALLPSKHQLLIATSRELIVYDYSTDEIKHRLPHRYTTLYCRLFVDRKGERAVLHTTKYELIYLDQLDFDPKREIPLYGAQALSIDFESFALIAIGCDDGMVRVWNPITNTFEFQLLGHAGEARSVRFSADGTRLVTSGLDSTVRIWNMKSGMQEMSFDWPASGSARDRVHEVGFSSDVTRIVACSSEVRIWDARTESASQFYSNIHTLNHVAISPDATRAIGVDGVSGGNVSAFDLESGRETAKLHLAVPLLDAAWGVDSTRLVVSGRNGYIAIISSTALGSIRQLLGHSPYSVISSLTYSTDGKMIISTSSDKTARIWDAETGSPRGVLRHPSAVIAAAMHADPSIAVTAGFDGVIRLWNPRAETVVAQFRVRAKSISGLSLSVDGTRLFVSSVDGSVTVWDIPTRTIVMTITGHTAVVTAAVPSPDGQLLATSSFDTTARVWDIKTGRQLALFRHQGEVLDVAWRAGGTKLISATPRGVRVWDATPEGRSLSELTAYANAHVPWKLVGGHVESTANR